MARSICVYQKLSKECPRGYGKFQHALTNSSVRIAKKSGGRIDPWQDEGLTNMYIQRNRHTRIHVYIHACRYTLYIQTYNTHIFASESVAQRLHVCVFSLGTYVTACELPLLVALTNWPHSEELYYALPLCAALQSPCRRTPCALCGTAHYGVCETSWPGWSSKLLAHCWCTYLIVGYPLIHYVRYSCVYFWQQIITGFLHKLNTER